MNYQLNISSFLRKYVIGSSDVLTANHEPTKMISLIVTMGYESAHLAPGPFQIEIRAERAGVVAAIDNFQLARIARLAGVSMADCAGVDYLKKLGDRVVVGEPLYRVHAGMRTDFEFARNLAQRHCGYRIEDDCVLGDSVRPNA